MKDSIPKSLSNEVWNVLDYKTKEARGNVEFS